MPSKWLDWTPERDEIIEQSSAPQPSKTSELGFDGFEGQPPIVFPIIQGHKEDPESGASAIEKAGDPQPSKPSERPTDPAPHFVPASDNGGDWPPESVTAERLFGQPHAKLFPLIGRKVKTPAGPGTLLQVFAERVTVLLDSDVDKCAVFSPEEIKAIATTGDH